MQAQKSLEKVLKFLRDSCIMCIMDSNGIYKEGIIKKILRKITAVLAAAGLMFPNRTLSVIDFGLKAFADADVA